MAHRIGGRKLSRKQGPRLSLFKNLTVSVIRYERVKTTEAKAKEISGRVEKVITLAKRGDLSARRAVVAQFPNEPLVVDKLFDEIAPKYADRTSGFTRIVRIGQRRGDAAEIEEILSTSGLGNNAWLIRSLAAFGELPRPDSTARQHPLQGIRS